MGTLDFLNGLDYSTIDDDQEEVFYDTGVYVLNFMFGGSMFHGMPAKINTVASPPHVGKSLVGYVAGKAFLEKDPERVLFIYDTESAINRTTFKSIFNTPDLLKRVVILGSKQKINIAENFSKHIRELLSKYAETHTGNESKIMIIIDSMAAFTSYAALEIIDSGETKTNFATQQILTNVLTAIVNDFDMMNIPVYLTTHAKPKVMATGFDDPITIKGVEAMKFFTSNIYILNKVKNKEDPIDSTVARFRPKKSRHCSSNFSMDLTIIYKLGIKKDSGLFQLMREEKLIRGSAGGGKGTKYTGKGVLDGIIFHSTEMIDKGLDEILGKKYMKKLDKYLIKKYRIGSQVISELDQDVTKSDKVYSMSRKQILKALKDMKVKISLEQRLNGTDDDLRALLIENM